MSAPNNLTAAQKNLDQIDEDLNVTDLIALATAQAAIALAAELQTANLIAYRASLPTHSAGREVLGDEIEERLGLKAVD